jgi:tRNA threonylcarbamoyladenosine biosynthesis protein TsaB
VADGKILAEATERTPQAHASSLPSLVTRVLADAGAGVRDLNAIAVSIGPGSFTGLRIGLGFAKGLVLARGLTLVGVPTLEALAEVAAATPGETICAALDARKQEVYAALFRAVDGGRVERLGADEALAPAALAERLQPSYVLVGDAAEVYADVLASRAVVRPFATHHPRGGVVGRLGWERLVAGESAAPGDVEPVYIRAPEAEMSRSPSR